MTVPSWVSALTDLGRVGEVYPVIEPDIRTEMQQEAALHWAEQRKAYQERLRTYQPDDLQPLPRARKDRTFLVDMSYTLDHDMKDQTGKVLYPRGFCFNPLEYMHLSIGLVVIDGSDPRQVRWFEESPYKDNHQVKLLISGGYAQDLILRLQRPVYYLSKKIAKRLQLTAVPCVTVQQGKQMQVTEFSIGGDK